MRALCRDPDRYDYLTGEKSGRMRMRILAGLGRLENPDAIREAAGYICEKRMQTSEALKYIANVRRDSS